MGQSVDTDKVFAELKATDVPISTADCRFCADPCDETWHEAFPKKFDVDMESQMLGSVKPYRRQVVISTGKSDWEREVTEAPGTLAAYLLEVQNKAPAPAKSDGPKSPVPGVFTAAETTRVSILNGSHKTISDDQDRESVLVFPDYKIVTEVSLSIEGANDLWNSAVDPALGRGGAVLKQSPLRTWVLPYSCVILLCSHRKRDNKCAIAAPKLENTFIHALEREGWEVHTQPETVTGPPLEDSKGTEEEKEADIMNQLKASASENKALILRNSHVGGHRYAGNCIIYTPQGSSVWYGRLTSHEIESVVKNTIIGGKVLPPLLRGGLNISRPGCTNLHDW